MSYKKKRNFSALRCQGLGCHCLQSLGIPNRDKAHKVITPSDLGWVHSVAQALVGSCFIKQESATVWLLQSCPEHFKRITVSLYGEL